MGSILAKMKEIWTGQPQERYEDDEGVYASEEYYDDGDYEEAPPKRQTRVRREYGDNVVSIHTTAQLQVVIVKPSRFDEVAGIADHLNDKRTVVLNLENSSKDVTRRIIDFLSGAAYANEGTIQKITTNTYIITPITVDLLGTDVLGELENNGVFF